MPTGMVYFYQTDETICQLRDVWFSVVFLVLGMSGLVGGGLSLRRHSRFFVYTNIVTSDQMSRFATSGLGLHYLPLSHLWDARYC